jgi:hypothetical protein
MGDDSQIGNYGKECFVTRSGCYLGILVGRTQESQKHFSQHNQCERPPLWSSGQSSCLQIRRPGFDSRHYQKNKVVVRSRTQTMEFVCFLFVVGLERGPLSLVSTTLELLDRKVAAPV